MVLKEFTYSKNIVQITDIGHLNMMHIVKYFEVFFFSSNRHNVWKRKIDMGRWSKDNTLSYYFVYLMSPNSSSSNITVTLSYCTSISFA